MANKSKYPQGCGIYAIEHIESGKRYIGSSQNMAHRLPTHVWKLRKGIHHSAHLQAAWCLYGESAFRFILVLQCETEQELLDCEQLEIEMQNAVDSGYNMAKFAGAPMRGRKMSEETKAKMRASHANRAPISEETRERHRLAAVEREQGKRESGFEVSEDTRKKLSDAGMGRVVSEETKEKIRIANSGVSLSDEHRQKLSVAHSGKTLTEEHRQKISEAGKSRWAKVRETMNMQVSHP